jgi:soluble lytic murein transglycosylase
VYYLLGSVYQRQNQPANSMQVYEMGLVQPPILPWTAKTLWALARLQEERQELARAVELYQRLAQDFPTYEKADSSLWQAGWLQYRQRHHHAATALWQSFEQRFPRSSLLPQVLYWQARVAQQGGQQDTALRLYQRIVADYPVHYYTTQGHASLQASGVRSALATDKTLPTTPVLLQDSALLPEQSQGKPSKARFHLVRVQELQQLQMYQPAGQEIRSLAPLLPSTPAAQYFLASLYVNNQQHAAAFRALNSVMEALSPAEVRGLPRDFWTILYPQVFWPEVSQLAQTKGLDPYLVLSIIRQESAFNPAAISSAGARGLMQLMPTTAQELFTKLKLPQESASRLHDPQLSITLGTHYFAGLMQRYQGNVVLALTGYNAGPARASRWREQWPGVPTDEFIERIPLDETRNYVKLILRNLMMYERLYKASQSRTVLESQ